MNALRHERVQGALEERAGVGSCVEQGGAQESEQEGLSEDKTHIIL